MRGGWGVPFKLVGQTFSIHLVARLGLQPEACLREVHPKPRRVRRRRLPLNQPRPPHHHRPLAQPASAAVVRITADAQLDLAVEGPGGWRKSSDVRASR